MNKQGISLRVARALRGWTQQDLALAMDCSRQTVQAMEVREKTGAVSCALLQKAATAMDCVFTYDIVPNDYKEYKDIPPAGGGNKTNTAAKVASTISGITAIAGEVPRG